MKESLKPLANKTVKQWQALQKDAQADLDKTRKIVKELKQMADSNEQYASNMNILLQKTEAEENHLRWVQQEQAQRDMKYNKINTEIEDFISMASFSRTNILDLTDQKLHYVYPIKDFLNQTEVMEWWINQNKKNRGIIYNEKSIEEESIWQESLKSLYMKSENENMKENVINTKRAKPNQNKNDIKGKELSS